ncbi:MAG: hypothetical protein JSV02_07080 [Dehalococcoidia bacterium]|nr:MAG: hypothetical protein JSV02_07080 [Dehalococcoidia bacterium]
MGYIKQYMPLSRIVMIMAVAVLVMGSVFIYQGVTKADWMRDAMRLEQVTVGLSDEAIANGNVVDTASEAQAAGDTIREHRRGIAETYNELLGEGRYDPTNPEHLTYAQALNMENYLYLGVLGFGVTDIAIAAGVFMILTGVALGATSIALRKVTAS